MTITYKSKINGKVATITQNRNGNWTLEMNGQKRYYKTIGGAQRYMKSWGYKLVEDTNTIGKERCHRKINIMDKYRCDYAQDIAIKHFGKRIIKSLNKKGLYIYKISCRADPEYGYSWPIMQYHIVDENEFSCVKTYEQVIELLK